MSSKKFGQRGPVGREPESNELESAAKWLAGKGVRLATRIPLAGDVVGFVFFRFEAVETYKKFLPILKALIGYEGRSSENVTVIIEVLLQTASPGARRSNFKREYIDEPEGWKKLPEDPKQIPYGFW